MKKIDIVLSRKVLVMATKNSNLRFQLWHILGKMCYSFDEIFIKTYIVKAEHFKLLQILETQIL